MKDNEYNEYYIKAEEWPGPKDEEPEKDEPATLDESACFVEGSTVKKKDTKETKKAQRKKADMLNKSAGLLVGAAAVVMVAGTITDGSNVQYTCPVCYVDNCEFWHQTFQCEYFFIKTGRGDFRTTPTGDIWQMGYFQGEETQAIYNETIAIQLSDGRRAYMRHLAEDDRYAMHCNNAYALNPQNVAAVQRLSYIDEKTDSEVFVELVYMPNGEEPEKTVIFENESMDYVKLKLAVEEDNLWIRAACDDKSVDLDYVLNAGEVFISDAHSYDLGDTLRFYDDEDVIRIWGDRNDYGYVRQLKGNLFRIECGYTGRLFKVCNVNGFEYELEISSVAFEEHYERWISQNETAKARGHRIYPVYRLEDVECNNMTYQVYLQDKETAVGYDGYNLVLSPVQEKNFAVTMSIDELAVDATTLQNGSPLMEVLTDSDFEKVMQVLDNIYLKDDITVKSPLATQNVPVSDNKALLDLSEYETVGWANGGVVPVQKDGLWGLIDYYGNEILEPTYTGFWCFPNDNGYTIFYEEDVPYTYTFEGQDYSYTEDNYYIVDKTGEVVTRWEGEIINYSIGEDDIIRLGHEHDGYVEYVYYRLDGSIIHATNFEDIEAGFYYNNATAFKDGAAYFYGVYYTGGLYDYEYVLYKLEPDGTLSVQEECSYVPVNNHSEGCMLVYNWGYATASCQLYDLKTRKLSNHFDYISGDLVPDFDYSQNSAITDWSYENIGEDGYFISNYGPYCVLNLTYNNDKTKDILIDFWDVGEDNVLDSCIAMYDDIIFDDYKYLAVQDGEQWYFINLDGDVVSGPYQDATSFNDEGYVVVIEDNVAYLVNDRFEALERIEGVQVSGASLNGNRFLLEDADGIQYLYNHDTN